MIVAYAATAQTIQVITLDEAGAERVLQVAKENARKRNAPSAIAVVDPAGDLLAFDRMNDVRPASAELAIDKARTAARLQRPTEEVEDSIKKAASFEDALRVAVEIMKRRFARYSAITAYVADGEDLAVHIALERPTGPDRVWTGGGPLAEAAQGATPTVVSDVSAVPAWAGVGLATGSALVAPVRTDAGLWAILEVWSDFRDAFTQQDVRLIGRVAQALGKKTPTA